MLCRVIFIFRLVIIFSLPFNNVKSITYAAMNKINIGTLSSNNIRLVIRTYMDNSAASIMACLLSSHWLIVAWMLRLSEGRARILELVDNPEYGPNDGVGYCYDFIDMIWLVPITFTTIGYGDFYPKSLWGRAFALYIGFFGILAAAVLVTVMTDKLTMTRRERLLTKTLKIDTLDHELKHRAATVLQRLFRKYRKGQKVLRWPDEIDYSRASQCGSSFNLGVNSKSGLESPDFSMKSNVNTEEMTRRHNMNMRLAQLNGQTTGQQLNHQDTNTIIQNKTNPIRLNTQCSTDNMDENTHLTTNMVSESSTSIDNQVPVRIKMPKCHNDPSIANSQIIHENPNNNQSKPSQSGSLNFNAPGAPGTSTSLPPPNERSGHEQNENSPANHVGQIPIIYDVEVLSAIKKFKRLRIKRKFTCTDTHDLVDLGILQADSKNQTEKIMDRITALEFQMSRLCEKLDVDLASRRSESSSVAGSKKDD